MAEEYISRKAVRDAIAALSIERFELTPAYRLYVEALDNVDKKIVQIPAADVVTRDCYDRILFENDVMRHQLSDIGKSFGEKMNDVKPVKHGDWIIERDQKGRCTECGYKTDRTVTAYIPQAPRYCPNCGAEMDGKK